MKILYVEDATRDIDLTRRELARHAPDITLDAAATLREARAALTQNGLYDLALIDMRLPDGNGLELLTEIRAQSLPLAVVILTGAGDEATAVAALKAGADDYVTKREDYLARLPIILETALSRFQADAVRRARSLRVLYAERNTTDIDLTRRHLSRYAPHIQLDVVYTVPEVLQRLRITLDGQRSYDVLLLDYQLHGLNALDLLKTLRQEHQHAIPVVLVTGQGDEEIAAQALRLGATEYLVKHAGYLFEVPAALENAYHHAELERERAALRASEAAERELRQSAEALRDSVAALAGSLEIDVVMQRFLEYAGRIVPYDTGSILLFEGDTARLAYWRNFSPEAEAFFKDYRFPVTSGKLKAVREDSQPYIIADTTLSPEWTPAPFENWVRSTMGIPIKILGEIACLLALDSTRSNHFKPVDVERLQTFAYYATATLENAYLHANLQRYTQALEDRVAARTAELAAERAQLRTIIDSMGEGLVYIALPERTIAYHNPAFSTLMSALPEVIIGKPIAVLEDLVASSSHSTFTEVVNSLEKHQIWQGELQIQLSEAQQAMTIELLATPILDGSASATGGVLLMRDISQQKALQAQKDRFIANAAHELRTPMTLIFTRLYLTRRQPDNLSHHLDLLDQAASHMRNLIESLLDLSRFEWNMITLTPTRIHVQELVSTIVNDQQTLADQKQIHLKMELSSAPLYAYMDATRIRQLLDNLITNAMNHTMQGNEITVRLFEESRHVVMQVEDTGIGISAQDLPKLFEPFYRVGGIKASGTGLGLPLSKEIVELHHGQITVDSQLGVGTTVTARMPIFGPEDT